MATATSELGLGGRSRPLAAAAALVLAGAAGTLAMAGSAGPGTAAPVAFRWLRPAAPPPGWSTARSAVGGALLAYPSGWRSIKTDPGTASAALVGPRGMVVGYLNATPRQGAETLANWASFRTAHIAGEGQRDVHRLASATRLRFRTALGSCVIDRYRTTATAYREIACLVAGRRAQTVVVAAAREGDWSAQRSVLERAVSSFGPQV